MLNASTPLFLAIFFYVSILSLIQFHELFAVNSPFIVFLFFYGIQAVSINCRCVYYLPL